MKRKPDPLQKLMEKALGRVERMIRAAVAAWPGEGWNLLCWPSVSVGYTRSEDPEEKFELWWSVQISSSSSDGSAWKCTTLEEAVAAAIEEHEIGLVVDCDDPQLVEKLARTRPKLICAAMNRLEGELSEERQK